MRFNGEHTRLVTLQQRDVTYNTHNEEVEDWDNNDQQIYAEFWDRQAKEGAQDGQVVVLQDVRCKIRYVSGLNEKDYRIKDGSTIYDIQSIVEVGRNKEQRLMLERRDNA